MPTSYGNLRIRAFTAGGALPVADAVVRIRGANEDNRSLAFSLVTDIDGVTEGLALPAPDAKFSLTPDPLEAPYSMYDIEISAKGFIPRIIYGVQIFSGINSLQPVNLIPISSTPPINYPRGRTSLESDI